MEQTRVAIPLLSNGIVSRQVRALTGWYLHNDELVYLHSGGALGPIGLINLAVELHEVSSAPKRLGYQIFTNFFPHHKAWPRYLALATIVPMER
jgi:hypothetical protein